MLRSMTACGRAATETQIGLFVVEILSVNRKFLDLQIQLPKSLAFFDIAVRKALAKMVKRGQLSIKISFQPNEKAVPRIIPNLHLVKELQKAWEEIIAVTGGGQTFDPQWIKDENHILVIDDSATDSELFENCIIEAVQNALRPLLDMKDREGRELQKDFEKRVRALVQLIQQIEDKTRDVVPKYQEKLIAILNEALGEKIEYEERILQEACIYADKVDNTEEITRFKSHLQQLKETIQSNDIAIGKKIEFLLQELSREVNTIGAKNTDLEVSKLVVETKTELERIREQVQNVE